MMIQSVGHRDGTVSVMSMSWLEKWDNGRDVGECVKQLGLDKDHNDPVSGSERWDSVRDVNELVREGGHWS